MAKLITIENTELTHFLSQKGSSKKYCQELEEGNILFFPTCPFEFPKEELEFLLSQKQTSAANRKNIAYKPQSDKITNFVQSSPEQGRQLLDRMRNYSKRSVNFLSQLLSPYAGKWRLDYASFRPFQEKGRQLRTRARNDLLHVDSFPTRPMHGSRILRFFTNINPNESRYWTTTEPFDKLAAQFGGKPTMPFPRGVKASLASKMIRGSKKLAHQLGFPVTLRSPYDVFMLNLHNFLKENEEFQKTCPKDYWEFPPNSCWAVYTDQVSHAATAGQYALEQTLIVPQSALIDPQKAPVSVLEKLTGSCMVDRLFSSS
jgi:hypothetical protein